MRTEKNDFFQYQFWRFPYLHNHNFMIYMSSGSIRSIFKLCIHAEIHIDKSGLHVATVMLFKGWKNGMICITMKVSQCVFGIFCQVHFNT